VTDNRTGGTTEYKYDTQGRLQEMDYPPSTGLKHTYGYDELDRLTSVVVDKSGTTRGSFTYQLGSAGNRTNLTENLNTVLRTVNYAYDSLYRLKSEAINGAAITYDAQLGYGDGTGFDKVGNRRSRAS